MREFESRVLRGILPWTFQKQYLLFNLPTERSVSYKINHSNFICSKGFCCVKELRLKILKRVGIKMVWHGLLSSATGYLKQGAKKVFFTTCHSGKL